MAATACGHKPIRRRPPVKLAIAADVVRRKEQSMRSLDYEDIRAFMLVVERRSITGAARHLNLSKSVVSKRISDLERDVGNQLLLRSTRGAVPTDAGLTFYDAALDSTRRLDAAVEAISERTHTVSGELRIAAPVSLTQLWLGDVMASFAAAHPDLRLAVELDDRIANIEAERFDVAIRVARLPDSALIARRVGVSRRVLVCSPEYIRKHGAPASLDDVMNHRCLCYSNAAISQTWSFRAAATDITKPRTLSPRGVFTSNNGDLLRDAAVRGLGIAVLPTFVVAQDLGAKRLVRILPDEHPVDDIIYAVYPRTPYTASKLRAFIDHIRVALINPPWDALVAANAPSKAA